MKTLDELKARFPYQFEGKNIGISVAKGWFPAFVQLCVEIDFLLGDDKRNFHWTQVKEKFGSARYYWAMDDRNSGANLCIIDGNGSTLSILHQVQADTVNPPSQLSRQIAELIDKASGATSTACIACGAPGTLDSSQGYVLVLCKEHSDARRRDKLPSFWFEAEQ